MTSHRASRLTAVGLGLAATVLAGLLAWPGSKAGLLGQALWRLELLGYDFRLANSAPHTLSRNVVIVTIDEGSIAGLGTWPWPRRYHARVIDNLASGSE